MIDLDDLRYRLAQDDRIVLDRAEAMQIITELETGRKLIGLPAGGEPETCMVAQRNLLKTLLTGLAAGICTEQDAELVAGVVTQEIAGIARSRVRAEECRR